MSCEIPKDIGESIVDRLRIDIHDGSSRARRKQVFTHRSLMQRFIPFAEDEQRRERRNSSQVSPPTPPTTPIPAKYSATSVSLREVPRVIKGLAIAPQLLDPEDELDVTSDEDEEADDMLTANESSDSSNSDTWSWNTATTASIVDLTYRPIEIQALPPPIRVAEEEPMDISQEDCAVVDSEPMRVGSFQGIVPKLMGNVEIFAQRDSFSESSDEEITRVFEDGSDDEWSLYSWNSSNSSNGRVNRPGRHADSVLDNRPYFLDNRRASSPYANLQTHAATTVPFAAPQSAHLQAPPPPYVQQQPQVPLSMPYIHSHPQIGAQTLPTQAQPTTCIQPQMHTDVNGNGVPLNLAVESNYNLRKTQRIPCTKINYQETRPRRNVERPSEAPYRLQMEYRRQQRRLRISRRRLATQFATNERVNHQNVYGTSGIFDERKSCGCSCHCEPKVVPVPVNSFAIERFLQEAQLSACATSAQATSYLLIPTPYVGMQQRPNWAPPAYAP